MGRQWKERGIARVFPRLLPPCFPAGRRTVHTEGTMPKITKRFVDSAPAGASGTLLIGTDDLARFGVRVKPSGGANLRHPIPGSEWQGRESLPWGGLYVPTPDEARRQSSRGSWAGSRRAGPLRDQERRLAERHDGGRALQTTISRRRRERASCWASANVPKQETTLATDRGRIERHIKPPCWGRWPWPTFRPPTCAPLYDRCTDRQD